MKETQQLTSSVNQASRQKDWIALLFGLTEDTSSRLSAVESV